MLDKLKEQLKIKRRDIAGVVFILAHRWVEQKTRRELVNDLRKWIREEIQLENLIQYFENQPEN